MESKPSTNDDGAQLMSRGLIRVDPKAMARKIDDELRKIVNEQLIPYHAYMKESLQGEVGFFVVSVIIGLMFAVIPFNPDKPHALLFFVVSFLASLVFAMALFEGICFLNGGDCFLAAIYKRRRALKFFAKISSRLHMLSMQDRLEVVSLRDAFIKRIAMREKAAQRIEARSVVSKQKIEEAHAELLDKARKSRL